VPKEKVTLNADSLLDIFIFIIIKSQCSSILSDIAMMYDYFAKIAKGEVAYILTTFQCAFTTIMEMANSNHPLKQLQRKPLEELHNTVIMMPDDDD